MFSGMTQWPGIYQFPIPREALQVLIVMPPGKISLQFPRCGLGWLMLELTLAQHLGLGLAERGLKLQYPDIHRILEFGVVNHTANDLYPDWLLV